jgi:hypothetical protein
MGRRTRKEEMRGVCVSQAVGFNGRMKTNSRMRLCSLGEGGCPVGVLPGIASYISKRESRDDLWDLAFWCCYLLAEVRVDWETGSAEREMRRRNETLQTLISVDVGALVIRVSEWASEVTRVTVSRQQPVSLTVIAVLSDSDSLARSITTVPHCTGLTQFSHASVHYVQLAIHTLPCVFFPPSLFCASRWPITTTVATHPQAVSSAFVPRLDRRVVITATSAWRQQRSTPAAAPTTASHCLLGGSVGASPVIT